MKLLIISACLVTFGDDRGGQHADEGDMPDVPKDTAHALVRAGRALYLDRADDPNKAGSHTASKEMIAAANAAAKAKAEAAAKK